MVNIYLKSPDGKKSKRMEIGMNLAIDINEFKGWSVIDFEQWDELQDPEQRKAGYPKEKLYEIEREMLSAKHKNFARREKLKKERAAARIRDVERKRMREMRLELKAVGIEAPTNASFADLHLLQVEHNKSIE